MNAATGLWPRMRHVLERHHALSARQIAEHVGRATHQVRASLTWRAKRSEVIRVLPPTGPLLWRLLREEERS